MRDDIYVQIPAYRDAELESTVNDLCRKADCVARVRVAVAWQHADGEVLARSIRTKRNVQVLTIPARQSKGPNWARLMLQEGYQGEQYTLFLDSHHRFVRGWDSKLIGLHQSLRARGVAKPIVTAYLPQYDPQRDPAGRDRTVLKIFPKGRDGGLLTRLTGYPVTLWQWLRQPIPADFVSLHLLFADGAFNQDIRFDPDIYFFGDEVLLSVRAFTFGYDLYHPHVIVGWHLYERATRVPHWDDHEDWRQSDRASLRRMREILRGRKRPRSYLGSARTVAEYERRLGAKLIEA